MTEPTKLTKRVVEALEPQDKPHERRDTEVRGFLVRVEPSGTKSFFFDYRINGKRNRYRLGVFGNLSVDGARDIATAIAGDVARGVDPQARKKADREQAERDRYSTLGAFLDGKYEPWAKTNLKSADFQLARIRSDFAEHLDKPLHAFNEFMVEGIRNSWKKDGLKARSINRDIQRLQGVLSKAVKWKALDKHPFAGLKQMKTDKQGRVRFLSAEEEAALRKALEDREENLRQARIRFNTWRVARGKKPLPEREGDLLDHLRPLVLVAINTGLRRGELLGLTWGTVNFSAKILTVTGTSAKSGHTRHIPLNTEALDVLTRWHWRRGRPGNDRLVFSGHDGERMTRIDTAWKTLVKMASLTNFRLHDCRHHFASWLVQKGVDLNTVRELLGHADIKMVLRYAHLAPDNLRLAVDKLVTADKLASPALAAA